MVAQKVDEHIRRVHVHKDSLSIYPQLWLRVFIPEHTDISEKPGLIRLFARANCLKAHSVDQADLVVFGGGCDVNPELYGAEPHSSTHFRKARDEADLRLFAECYAKGIPMVGICRGAQFGWVMGGGSLYQDINNHNKSHDMFDQETSVDLTSISSVHHQSCMSDKDLPARIIATSSEATTRWIDPMKRYDVKGGDIEAFDIPDMAFFGVQGHPEYTGFAAYSAWFCKKLAGFFEGNKWDLMPTKENGGSYRLSEGIREERKVRNKHLQEALKEIA